MSTPLAVPATHTRRMLTRCSAVASLALLTACAPVTRRGLEPIVTDRPDFTESAETVPEGMRQLEAGTTYSNAFGERSASLGEALLRVGLSRGTELRLAFNSYAFTRSSGVTIQGFEDVSLGTKLKLFNGGGEGSLRPTTSLILGTTIPTGAREVGTGKPQPEVKVVLAWDLTSRVSFASNLNYGRETDEIGDYTQYAATGSLGIGLTEHLASYVEVFSFHPQGVPVASTHFVNGGLTYGFTDNLQLDIRSGLGLHRIAGPDYFFGLGISRRW